MEFFDKHLILTLVLALMSTTCISASSWEKAGCHKVGHTRKIRVPGCVVFDITTNACRGFCQSYSTPSPEWILESNSRQSIWSVGECCNIMETEDIMNNPLSFLSAENIANENDTEKTTQDENMVLQNIVGKRKEERTSQFEKVLVEVMCLGGMKDLVFKSAKTCSCYHCKKE